MIQQFDVVLFLELGKELISTVAQGRRGEQHRQTVVAGIGLRGGGIEGKLQAITGCPTTHTWWRQGRLLLGRQGHELPVEVTCRPACTKESVDRTTDGVRSDMCMTTLHAGG